MKELEQVPQIAGVERRFVPQQLVQYRATEEDGADPVIEGFVALYNNWSPVYGWFREQIAPGFFTPALERDDIRGLFNHDVNYVLGRTSSGTMKLVDAKEGLRNRITIAADSKLLRDLVVTPMKRQDITGASFSFDLPPEDGVTWKKGADGVWERTLVTIGTLYDVGPVTFPFYPDTIQSARAAVLNLDEAKHSLERWLRSHPEPKVDPGLELELLERQQRLAAIG